MAEGRTPKEAREAALRTVGNVTLAVEQVRDLSPWAWFDQLRQDVRYGMRAFSRTPAFALTVVLTLALGVGANGAIFSVIDALMLRPLPVAQPEALVAVRSAQDGNYSYPDVVAMRDRNGTLTALSAASSMNPTPVGIGGESERAHTKLVTGNYFTTLGVGAGAGRLLGGSDLAPEVVLSDGYWTRRFNRAPDVLGRSITVNSVPLTIVGIAPAGFFGEVPGEWPDLWASLAVQRPAFLNERGFSWLYIMGRLKPQVSEVQAQANLTTLLSNDAAVPAGFDGPRLLVTPGVNGLSRWRDRVASPLVVLMAIVGVVLLIACANLATLLLTRATSRRREISMRMAIGASRGRVIRQLLTESLLLSAAGGALSVAFAAWGGRVLVRMASAVGTGPDLSLPLAVDGRLLLFTAALSVVAGVVLGMAPALREVQNAARTMTAAHGRVIGAERTWSLRGALIAMQVALSLILVAGSVMFIRTLRNLDGQDMGFRREGLARVELEPERGYRPPADVAVRLVTRLSAIPGIDGATPVAFGTLNNRGGVTGLQVDGFAPRDAQDQRARADWVGPAYLRIAGVRLVAGRDFSPQDGAGAAGVAVVNQVAARFYFGSDAAALSRHFLFNKKDYEIVGVAANAKYAELREETPRMIYFSALQREGAFNAFEIRSAAADTGALTTAIRAAVREVDPRLAVGEVLTVAERVDRKLGREHLVADLSSFFSGLTLLLVSIGVYGTLAYLVGQRTKEIGVRLALGARRSEVIALVLRQIGIVMATGVVLGCAGAFGLARLVRALLFGLEPGDPITFLTAATVLIGVALTAGFLPAFRASRLDPAQVLRE